MLYHKEIGFPSDVALPCGDYDLHYNHHARREASRDKYGTAQLPRSINVEQCDIFELEVMDSKVTKFGVRMDYDADKDLVLIIRPEGFLGRVRTVWFNQKADTHTTLDMSRYDVPMDKEALAQYFRLSGWNVA